jgi:hypothetical protein
MVPTTIESIARVPPQFKMKFRFCVGGGALMFETQVIGTGVEYSESGLYRTCRVRIADLTQRRFVPGILGTLPAHLTRPEEARHGPRRLPDMRSMP